MLPALGLGIKEGLLMALFEHPSCSPHPPAPGTSQTERTRSDTTRGVRNIQNWGVILPGGTTLGGPELSLG